MKFSTILFARLRIQRSLIFLIALFATGFYASYEAFAHYSGITGVTQKGLSPGCTCHCPNPSSGTSVTVSTTATTITAGSSYTFSASVSNANENAGGIDIAVSRGSLSTIAGQGLNASNSELTHSVPKSLPATWSFTYTAPSTTGYDTIYATGNAVNGDGLNNLGNCTDNWNHATKYVIQVVAAPSKTLAVGRNSISVGSLRVGRRSADSVAVRSVGTGTLTVTSSSMKNGTSFSTSPTSTNRTLSAGATEIDSVIFQPTARGAIADSLIINTNGDTPQDQRKAIYVYGQAIQAVFGGSTNPIAFNNVRTGRTARSTYQIQNTGDDTLFLQSPSIQGTGYTISTSLNRLTLAPNERDSLTVQFSPTAKQSYSGTLTFSAAGITAPTLNLTGTGVAPQLTASNTSGFGGSRIGQGLQGTVNIRNSGSDTLHISNAALTQNGNKFSLGSYDASVAPSAGGLFRVSYNPTSERTDSATLTFSTDDASNATLSILLTASGIAPHMSVVDHDTVNMGQIKVGASVSRDFGILNSGTDALTIHTVTVAPNPPFSFFSKESSIGAGQIGYATIKFTAPSVGVFEGSIIVSGDDALNPSDTIYITGSGINSALSVPASLNFNSSNVGQQVQQTLTLQNTGAAEVKILSYKLISSSTVFGIVDTSAHQVAANASSPIKLSFTPSDAIVYTGTLQILTDDASTPLRTVSLTGRGLKGALSLNQSSVDFGALDTGKSISKTVTIHNTGSAPVLISGVAASGSHDFSIASMTPVVVPPHSLKAGDSIVATIAFRPTLVGAISGTVAITTADNTSSTLQLSGVGLAVKSSVASSQTSVNALSIAPNPASGTTMMRLTASKGEHAEIRMYNLAGHQVLISQVGTLSEGAQQIELNVASLPSGSYFVRVTTSGGEILDGRIVIEH